MVHAASAAFVLELPDATEAACTRAPKSSSYFADTTLVGVRLVAGFEFLGEKALGAGDDDAVSRREALRSDETSFGRRIERHRPAGKTVVLRLYVDPVAPVLLNYGRA